MRKLAHLWCTLAAGAALWALLAPRAVAQGQPWPFPGSAPIKTVTGPDVGWNGTSYQAPPGSELIWEITVINDYVDGVSNP